MPQGGWIGLRLQRPCVHCLRQAATGLPVYMASTSHFSPQAAFLYGDLVKPHRRWSRGFHTLVHLLKHISHKRPLSSACRLRRGFCASWQMQTSWGGGTASSCSAPLSTGATSASFLMPWSVPTEAAAWCLIKDRPPACSLCRRSCGCPGCQAHAACALASKLNKLPRCVSPLSPLHNVWSQILLCL